MRQSWNLPVTTGENQPSTECGKRDAGITTNKIKLLKSLKIKIESAKIG
jgi:hypothetical protein